MSMSGDLRDRLKTGTVAGARIYRDERPPKSPLPAVRMQVISDPRPSTMEGRQALRETTVQCDCMGTERAEADQLAEQVIAIAEQAGTVGTTSFQRSFVDGLRTYSERSTDGVVTYVSSLDLRVWHQPAA